MYPSTWYINELLECRKRDLDRQFHGGRDLLKKNENLELNMTEGGAKNSSPTDQEKYVTSAASAHIPGPSNSNPNTSVQQGEGVIEAIEGLRPWPAINSLSLQALRD